MSTWPDEIIDLTVTSPPYDGVRNYQGYEFDFPAIAGQLWRVTKPGGVLVWVVNDQYHNGSRSLTSFRQAIHFQEAGWLVHDVMVWDKGASVTWRSNGYTAVWEMMLVLSKDSRPKTFHPVTGPKTYWSKSTWHRSGRDKEKLRAVKDLPQRQDKVLTNVWRLMAGGRRDHIATDHPAAFPERLAEMHIRSWSDPGDLVLDPMVGSGTVPKVCVANSRDYVGIDISPDYVTMAEERVRLATPPLFPL